MTDAELGAIAAGGILGGVTATASIIMLVVKILIIVAEWRIFTKAGEAGWKSLIPIYNLYILYRIIGMSFATWFVLPVIGGAFVFGLLGALIPALQTIFSICTIVIYVAMLAKVCDSLGNSFGKGFGFKLGMFFLPNLFTLILGFGSAEYIGPGNRE